MGKRGSQYERGSNCVPIAARELYDRDDFDRECHFEVDEAVNMYLRRHAVTHPNMKGLYLAGVNIDGPRVGVGAMCVWHPKLLALELKTQLLAAAAESEEAHLLRYDQERKDLRRWAHAQVKRQEEIIKTVKDSSAAQRQFAWERKKMEEDC